jgi:hypothetical protein
MKKFFISIFAVILLLFFATIFTLGIFSRIHHKTTHEEVVNFLNHHIAHQVEFGDFNLSLIKRFPNILIELDDIRIHDGEQEILKVGELDVVINLKNLRMDSFELNRIIASQVIFNSVIDENGKKPVLFNSQNKTYQPKKRYLSLESHDLELIDAQLFFENKVKGNQAYISFEKGRFELEIKDRHIRILGEAAGKIDSIISNHNKLFSNLPVKAENASITIDQDQQLTHISGDAFYLLGIRLKPEIEFKKQDDGQTINLVIEGENDFDQFMEAINLQFGFEFKQVNPGAQLKLAYRQHGFVNPFKRPYSEVDFEIMEAAIESSSLPYPVTDIWLKGNLNNGDDHDPSSSNILIDTLSARIADSYVHSKLHLTNLKDPFIDGVLQADINLAHLFENGKIRSKGKIEANLVIKDKISELKKVHLDKDKGVQGNLKLVNADLEMPAESLKIKIPHAEILLVNHQVSLRETVITLNNSTFNLQGKLEDLQNIWKSQESICGNFQVDFHSFNVSDLALKKDTLSEKKQSFKIPGIHFNIGINGKELITQAGKFTNIKLKTVVDPNGIDIKNFNFNYQAGSMKGNLTLKVSQDIPESIKGNISCKFNSLNLDELKFSQKSSSSKGISLPKDTDIHFDIKVAQGKFQGQAFHNVDLAGELFAEELKIGRMKTNILGGQFFLYADAKFNKSQGLWYLKANGNTRLYHLKAEELLSGQKNKNDQTEKNRRFQMPEHTDIQLGFQVDTLDYGDFNFYQLKTGISLTKDHLNTDEFTLRLPSGKANVSLRIQDYLKEKPFIKGEVDLLYDTLEIENLIQAVSSFHPQKTSSHRQKIFKIPGNIDLTLHLESDWFKFKELLAEDFQLDASLNNEILMIDLLKTFYKNNLFEVYGSLGNNQYSQMTGHIYNKMSRMPMEDVLQSFDNFNQDQFTNQNATGNLSWEADYYLTLTPTLQPLSDQNYLKFDFTIHDGIISDNEMINKILFFIGHRVKEEIHINNATFNTFLYKDWIIIKDVKINNSISNIELFGSYHQPDSLLDLHLNLSLNDLFFRSGAKRKIQTDEGVMNLEKDASLFIDLSGSLAHQLIKIRNKRKHNAAQKDQMQFISMVEKDFQNQIHQFYQNKEYVLGNRKINSTFELSMD